MLTIRSINSDQLRYARDLRELRREFADDAGGGISLPPELRSSKDQLRTRKTAAGRPASFKCAAQKTEIPQGRVDRVELSGKTQVEAAVLGPVAEHLLVTESAFLALS